MPKVFVSLIPAELILLTGDPTYLAVAARRQPAVGRATPTPTCSAWAQAGDFYYLVAGRWFSAPDLDGPWTFATPTLPEEFKRIPIEHERSRVLASVPGTQQATEAVLLAQIPQTARVSKKDRRRPRSSTTAARRSSSPSRRPRGSRAVNTDKDILKVGDLYYMCFQGVWFMSQARRPGRGKSPGTCRSRSTRFRRVRRRTRSPTSRCRSRTTTRVVFATAMAFTGLMIAWGCAVWGSG